MLRAKIDQKLFLRTPVILLFLRIACIMFISELLIMFFLPLFLPKNTSELILNLLDASLLTMITSITLLPLLISFRRLASDAELALNITNDGYWDVAADGRIVGVNPGYCQMVGYTREQILTMRISDFTDKSVTDINAHLKRIVSNVHERFETNHRHRNGKIINIEISVSFVAETQHFICFLRDITERKLAEVALKTSATSLQTTLDNSPYLVWLKDADGRYTTINKALSEYIGLKDIKDVVNKTDFDIWPKDLAEKYHIDDTEIMATGKKRYIEEQIFDGKKLHWIETFKTPIIDESGNVLGTTGFSRDITERKNSEALIHKLAYYDALTQLPNRRLLKDRLCQAMATSKRSGKYAALMFLDLDNFKPLNDMHGHEVGDLLLIEVAHRLTSCVRETDTVARFGGDEFIVMLTELDEDFARSTALANQVAGKIRTAIARPYMLSVQHERQAGASVEHHCTSSIGVVLFIGHEAVDEDVIKWADLAMYQAKHDGRNLIRFYT